jgi:hypothetical protein
MEEVRAVGVLYLFTRRRKRVKDIGTTQLLCYVAEQQKLQDSDLIAAGANPHAGRNRLPRQRTTSSPASRAF